MGYFIVNIFGSQGYFGRLSINYNTQRMIAMLFNAKNLNFEHNDHEVFFITS